MKTDPRSPEATGGAIWSRALDFALRRDANFLALHFAYGVFALFTLVMAFHHVPWRDEAGPWLFARDLSLTDLFHLTRHEGHPILWFFCVKAVESTGVGYLGMMVVNWAFSAAAIGLLFYRSTLPFLARLAVAFAPIMLLEVAFTARDYAIAVFFCFWAAALYPGVQAKPIRFSVVLAFLASTNLFAAAVFVGISFQFLLEQACGFGTKPYSLRPLFQRYLGANAILALGAVLLFVQLVPVRFPGDPFPDAASPLTPVLANLKPSVLLAFLSPALLVLFSRGPGRPRVLGGLPIILLAAVPIVLYGVAGRHRFMLALPVIYFCWIYLDSFLSAGKGGLLKLGSIGTRTLVTLLIAFAVFVSTPAPFEKVLHPPHDATRAAEAMIAKGLDRPDTLLVATDPFRTMPLLLFFKNIRSVEVPPQFGPSPQAFGFNAYVNFFKFNPPTLAQIRPLVADVAQRNPGKTIVVVATGPQAGSDPGDTWVPIYQTPPWPDPDIGDESYGIYVLRTR